MKASTMAGRTNIEHCRNIMSTIPLLLSPIILMIPVSNVFDSSLIRSSEYINNTDIMINISSTISNIKWKKSIPIEKSCISSRTIIYVTRG